MCDDQIDGMDIAADAVAWPELDGNVLGLLPELGRDADPMVVIEDSYRSARTHGGFRDGAGRCLDADMSPCHRSRQQRDWERLHRGADARGEVVDPALDALDLFYDWQCTSFQDAHDVVAHVEENVNVSEADEVALYSEYKAVMSHDRSLCACGTCGIRDPLLMYKRVAMKDLPQWWNFKTTFDQADFQEELCFGRGQGDYLGRLQAAELRKEVHNFVCAMGTRRVAVDVVPRRRDR
jgi:hypothetical protein